MEPKIAVIIPCFKVSAHILGLLGRIGPEVWRIYVVDDCCPEQSGSLVQQGCQDPRVRVLTHSANQGVGGAVIRGYEEAMHDGADIAVKLDGDGQMPPELIRFFVEPIVRGTADYVKGNRFFALEFLNSMPRLRVLGNAALSFISKAASGYWNLMDPTNGYTAIHVGVLKLIPLDKLDRRYFFESDMLFRLNTIRAVVVEVPMHSVYGDERSSLKIMRVLVEFPLKFSVRVFKRIIYNYFLRDFNVCSLELLAGIALLALGTGFGVYHWYLSSMLQVPATTGTVILAALPIILGVQLVLAAISYDVANVPKRPLNSSPWMLAGKSVWRPAAQSRVRS